MPSTPSVPIPPEADSNHPCEPGCNCTLDERLNCQIFRLVAATHDPGAGSLAGKLFASLPPPKTADLYGVRYAVFEGPDFGQLMVTRYGWSLLQQLMPANWYAGGRFWREGERLGQSTGTVYRFKLPETKPSFENIVIKVSRFAQDVPFYAGATFLEKIPESVIAGLRFNNPFEEFGRLWRLRATPHGTRILTKKPLAIYSPPEKLPLWQHGRTEGAAGMEQRAVAGEQTPGHAQVDLDPQRSYFSIFGWVRGLDASSLYLGGQLAESTMAELTAQSTADLMQHGMIVLDHKPAHIVIRWNPRTRDWVRRSDGRIAYVLVDYELLVELPEPPLPSHA
jgi:hypothetical protein